MIENQLCLSYDKKPNWSLKFWAKIMPKKGKDIPEYFGEKVHIGNISLDLSLIDLTLLINQSTNQFRK